MFTLKSKEFLGHLIRRSHRLVWHYSLWLASKGTTYKNRSVRLQLGDVTLGLTWEISTCRLKLINKNFHEVVETPPSR